ncbi:MAG TPA: amidohydrolase family protein, partial [bacterium]|nr:amidohydrolase family protein [bacterium]
MQGFILGDAVVVTVNQNMDVISGGAVAVIGNKIAEVDKTDIVRKKYPNLKYIDTKRALVMPGLVNTHTHLPMSLVRGLAEDLALHEWLYKTYDFKVKYIPRPMFHYGVRLSLLELLKNGTTTICDMSFHQYMIAEIVQKYKLRAVLCDTMMETYFNDQTFKEMDIYLNTDYGQLITKAIALHAPYTCSLPQFDWLKKMIEKYPDILYSIHLLEAKTENANFKKRFGITPIALLKKMNLLSERLLAIHCVWLNDKEIDLFQKYDVKVSYCPESNMKLGS